MQQFLINMTSSFKTDNISNIIKIIDGEKLSDNTLVKIFNNINHNISDEKKKDDLCDIIFNKCTNKEYFFNKVHIVSLSLYCLKELFKYCIERGRCRIPLMFDHILSLSDKKILLKYITEYQIQSHFPKIYHYGAHLLTILSHAYIYDDVEAVKIIISDQSFCRNISGMEVAPDLYKIINKNKFLYHICKNNHINFLRTLFKNKSILSNYKKKDSETLKISIGDRLDTTAHPTYIATLNGNIDLLNLLLIEYGNQSSGYIAILNICVLLQQKVTLSFKDDLILMMLLKQSVAFNMFSDLIHHIYETYDLCIEKYLTSDLFEYIYYQTVIDIAEHKKSHIYDLIVNNDLYKINFSIYKVFKPKKSIDSIDIFASADTIDSSSNEDSADILSDFDDDDSIISSDLCKITQEDSVQIEHIIKHYITINNMDMLQRIRNKYDINFAALNYSVVKFAYILSETDPLLFFMKHRDVNPHYDKIVIIICGNNDDGMISIVPKDMIRIIIGNILDELWYTIWTTGL
jgi:predicted transcriptional regulator